jgi:CBS domain-containing protein
MRIMDVMAREVATVSPDSTLKEVATILERNGISGAPVVDGSGRVLGVVSETDLVAASGQAGRTARTASEVMTAPAITIDLGRRVYEAARLMTERGVNRLPVLNDGTLVGIVSRADLVRAFTRQDDAIRQEITDDVVVQVLRIPAERVQVAVSEGSVTLTGALADQRDTELLVRLAERVPGVVSVRSLLTPPLGDEATP